MLLQRLPERVQPHPLLGCQLDRLVCAFAAATSAGSVIGTTMQDVIGLPRRSGDAQLDRPQPVIEVLADLQVALLAHDHPPRLAASPDRSISISVLTVPTMPLNPRGPRPASLPGWCTRIRQQPPVFSPDPVAVDQHRAHHLRGVLVARRRAPTPACRSPRP